MSTYTIRTRSRSLTSLTGGKQETLSVFTPSSSTTSSESYSEEEVPGDDSSEMFGGEDMDNFSSCLRSRTVDSPSSSSSSALNAFTDEVHKENWLSSSVLDLCLSKFARTYGNVRYLSVDFANLSKSKSTVDYKGEIQGVYKKHPW